MIGAGCCCEEGGGVADVLYKHRGEILGEHQVSQLAPESSVLGEACIGQGPHSLGDTLSMEVINLIAEEWQ